MIQRIQTVFLFLAVVALGLFLWMPLIQTEPAIPDWPAGLQGWKIVHSFMGYLYFINPILVGTAIGLTLINIFLYKNRELQMLICWFAVVFTIAAAAYVYYKYYTKVFFGMVILTPWNLLAGAAVLFLILAWVNIRKDENLVKSVDRLR